MNDQARENLVEWLKQVMDAESAQAANEEIRAGERLLATYSAPNPDARTLTVIKARMVLAAARRRRKILILRGSLAAAAAVVVIAMIGLLGPGSTSRAPTVHAAIIPTAIWESDNIEADDLDLVYFTSEIRRIEAQMQALEAGESESRGSGALQKLEMELMNVEIEFWKG